MSRHSNAQKTKSYDMYTRFYRWASDRLDKNGNIAFITNNSFLEKNTHDGFRKVIADEFSHIYIVDLGGSVKDNPKLSGTTHNVFGIQAGVAIAFMVKADKKGKSPAQIFYIRRPEFELASDKLEFLRATRLSDIQFEHIQPDKKHNWLHVEVSDWESLIPVADKNRKKAVFDFYSLGVSTNRDEWVYDFDPENLERKIEFFIRQYNGEIDKLKLADSFNIEKIQNLSIKWSDSLKNSLSNKKKLSFNPKLIIQLTYRPFVGLSYYSEKTLSDRLTSNHTEIFTGQNTVLCFTNPGSQKPFMSLASNQIPNLHLVGAGAGTQCLPLYRYSVSQTSEVSRTENITDWALGLFQKHYKDKKISKEDIFHYVYSVLHHPAYRAKYEINLKREFRRIPFYEGFWKWAGWGKKLMELHLGYEVAAPYPLERLQVETLERSNLQTRLIARKDKGIIEIDSQTPLRGVPAEAWEYRLGTYSALEWILERYKEKKTKDPTIAEKFNTYKFGEYKEQVIELLCRVCTVSVETMKIVKEMGEKG